MSGQQVALLVTILLTAGIAVWAISHLVTIYVEGQDRRRRAARFEAPPDAVWRRLEFVIEDPTDDLPTKSVPFVAGGPVLGPRPILVQPDGTFEELGPDACPTCGRNAGHDHGCYVQRQQRRAAEIEIPREGETK